MPPELQKLRNLLEIVDRGSFSSAALSLGIAQSALSRHIQELEQVYGQRLLHRTGRGVVPTEVAERFLPRVRALLHEAEQLSHDILAARGEVVGRVRLGSIHSIGGFIITPLLREISTHYPRIAISIRDGLTDHINEWLAAGLIDLAVSYADHSNRRASDALMLVDYYVVGASGDPQLDRSWCTMREAATLPMVLPNPQVRWRLEVERVLARHGLSLQVAIETDSVQTIMDLVRSPDHYSIVPMHLAAPYVANGVLVSAKIVDPVITRRVDLLYPSPKTASSATKVVADILRRQVRSQVAAGGIPGARTFDDV